MKRGPAIYYIKFVIGRNKKMMAQDVDDEGRRFGSLEGEKVRKRPLTMIIYYEHLLPKFGRELTVIVSCCLFAVLIMTNKHCSSCS